MFGQIILPGRGATERDHVFKALARKGFRGLLDTDKEMLELAELSLIFGGSGGSEAINQGEGRRAWLTDRISFFNERFGEAIQFEPFKNLDGRIFSLL